MVANEARRSDKRKRPPLDENGHPIMQGVDMSCSEDPAAFWGKHWEAAFQEAEDDRAAGRLHRFATLEEMFAGMESGGPPSAGTAQAETPADADL